MQSSWSSNGHLLKYINFCPNQISITIWKLTTWVRVCIEHEVEVAISTKKHWLVYVI